MWLKIILSILGICIFATPAVNYWSKICEDRRFKDGVELFAYTILQCAFNGFALWLVYLLYQTYTGSNSLVPIFILSHAFLFAALTIMPPIMYGILCLTEQIKKNISLPKIIVKVHKRVIKFSFFQTYYNSEEEVTLDFLSGVIIKKYIIVSYLVCGIVTSSGISNSLIILLCKQPNISKSFTEFSTVYNNDLKLYTDIFLMSALSFVLSKIKTKST
jgi:hypothetical protein